MFKIHTLDLNFQSRAQAIASYLVEGPEGFTLVECGPASTWRNLLVALQAHGLVPADLKAVLVTHIHLDHAGAAGYLAREGPRVYVHHKGAQHLIDPARLLTSAQRIYGDRMDELWGDTQPVPRDQVIPLQNGQTIASGGLVFQALDTPGHATHHMAFLLPDLAFTGDVGAVRLPGEAYISLPAPPPEFHVETWLESVRYLKALNLKTIYPTHFGGVDNPAHHLQQVEELIVGCADVVRAGMEQGLSREQLVDRYLAAERQRALEAGMAEEAFDTYEAANPLFMSVDGIMRYWRKKWEKAKV